MREPIFGKLLTPYLLILPVLLLVVVSLQAQEGPALLPVQIGGKWGFIDPTGKIALEPQFVMAREFSDGLAPVWIDTPTRKCGYINVNGKFAIDAIFEDCQAFAEGLAAVKVRNRYGYISKDGKIKIPPRWQMAWAFSGGLARVSVGDAISTKYGFINSKGRLVIPTRLVYANDFSDNVALAAVSDKKGLKLGFLNRVGNWIIRPEFGSATDFSEGFACVTRQGRSHLFEGALSFDPDGKEFVGYFVNKMGKRAFRKTFRHCGKFSEGLAAVDVGGKWSYINRKGEEVISTQFTSAADVAGFSNGLAAINFVEGAKFIDVHGIVVIATGFDFAQNFVRGISLVKSVGKDGVVNTGYIDKSGIVIWTPTH